MRAGGDRGRGPGHGGVGVPIATIGDLDRIGDGIAIDEQTERGAIQAGSRQGLEVVVGRDEGRQQRLVAGVDDGADALLDP
jgi:hypothetical protein